jgi:hypothetical protein
MLKNLTFVKSVKQQLVLAIIQGKGFVIPVDQNIATVIVIGRKLLYTIFSLDCQNFKLMLAFEPYQELILDEVNTHGNVKIAVIQNSLRFVTLNL